MKFYILLVLIILFSNSSHANSNYAISAQQYALAPNAGGQTAWSLRLSKNDDREYSIFVNEYLQTGSFPLMGTTYDFKYALCGRSCFLQSAALIGFGISSAGPLVNLTWSFTPLWIVRIDFSTHIYAIPSRLIVWNYPLWLGITVPF